MSRLPSVARSFAGRAAAALGLGMRGYGGLAPRRSGWVPYWLVESALARIRVCENKGMNDHSSYWIIPLKLKKTSN